MFDTPKGLVPDKAQLIIRDFLRDNPIAMLNVGMGVGKTIGCLLRIRELICAGECYGVLVVAPTRVANLTWPAEIKSWPEFRWMRVANLRTPEGKRAFLDGSADVYVVNYESLPALCKLVKKCGGCVPYNVVVFDEISKAKNPSSKRVNKYRASVPMVDHIWGLTGTLVPNSLMDLFAPYRLLDGGKRLGERFMSYRDTYFTQAYFGAYKWDMREGAASTIEDRIHDITLTLRSKDWLGLPEPVIEDIEVPLSEGVQQEYDTFERELVLQLMDDQELTAANAAVLTNKLLQFTSGAVYLQDSKEHALIHSAKLFEVAKLAKTVPTLLVVVAFQHEQQRIRRRFPEAKFFADAVTVRDQEELVKQWNAGAIKMLVCHPASVGHGLNLQHGGFHMVWTSLTYSREQYEQMICRLARRGQKEQVTVYRLICPGTIDEVVAEVVAGKARLESMLQQSLIDRVRATRKRQDPQTSKA